MLGFLARRLFYLVPVLLAVSLLTFLIASLLPGDLASAILQNSATPESLAKLRLDLGLDQPAYVRFFEWLFGALRGDFGHSLANGRDVLTEIAPRFANTMFLAAYAAIVAVPLAIGLGINKGLTSKGASSDERERDILGAEVHVVIFELRRPVVPERIFNSGTDRITRSVIAHRTKSLRSRRPDLCSRSNCVMFEMCPSTPTFDVE